MNKKVKRITFSLSPNDFNTWESVTEELVRRRVFRSKIDAFETFVNFLLRAEDREIEYIKRKSTVLPLDEPKMQKAAK
jgi:hypothetical protein